MPWQRHVGADIEYDGYVLATSWANTKCEERTCNSNLNLPKDFFNLHGLWPTNFKQKDSPRECSESNFILSSMPTDVQKWVESYWNSLYGPLHSLVSHEWRSHGTCMNFAHPQPSLLHPAAKPIIEDLQTTNSGNVELLKQAAYIRLSVKLSTSHNIYKALESQKILPGSNSFKSFEIQTALKKHFNISKLEIICQTSKENLSLLQEVRLCLDTNFHVIDCQRDKLACAGQVYYRD